MVCGVPLIISTWNRLARAPFSEHSNSVQNCLNPFCSRKSKPFLVHYERHCSLLCGVTLLTQFGDTTLMWKIDVWNRKSGWRIEGHGVTIAFACRMMQSGLWFLSAAYLMPMSTRFFLESKFVSSNLLDSNLWLEISLLRRYCLWCCSKWSHSH